MRLLEENRLVGAFQVGRTRLYRRLVNSPEFRYFETELPLEAVGDTSAKTEHSSLDEENVRGAIRSLISRSDMQSFRQFLCPLYKVELMLKRKKRIVWLDGRGGGEVKL